jgi:hypothetical protein
MFNANSRKGVNPLLTEYKFELPEKFKNYKEIVNNMLEKSYNNNLGTALQDPFFNFAYLQTLKIPEIEAEYTWNWIKENKNELDSFVLMIKPVFNLDTLFAYLFTIDDQCLISLNLGFPDSNSIRKFKNKLKRYNLNDIPIIKQF